MEGNGSVNASESLRKASIALVGPVTPYRGGISHYTGQLQKALEPLCELHTFSFKRLYPMWLYPGGSDKEPGMEELRLPGVDYSLDIYSPLSLRRTADKIADANCDVAIISWWTLIWQPGLARLTRRLKQRGVKVAFLCHNLFDHDATGLKRSISEKLLKQADAYIVHSKDSKAMLAALKPQAPILLRPHPIYTRFPAPNKKLKKRGRLELLFFGMIRSYKGLDILVEALKQIKDEEVYLTVAGKVWGEAEWLKVAAAPNLELHLEYIDDQTVANYYARADVVVLPYRSATGSGPLTLAYHFGKPVLATRVGGLKDAVVDGETGWLAEPGSPESLAKVISDLDRHQIKNMKSEIKKFCQENSWEAMAQAVVEFANSIT